MDHFRQVVLALKITKIGNSAGILLPTQALARLAVEPGNTVCLTETADGYRITRHGPDFERQMKLARRVMKEHRGVLRELAR